LFFLLKRIFNLNNSADIKLSKNKSFVNGSNRGGLMGIGLSRSLNDIPTDEKEIELIKARIEERKS
jgi:hypothetical protein